MKPVLLALLFVAAAFAQDPDAVRNAQAACGPKSARFDVKPDPSQHPTPEPQGGEALVYVISEASGCVGCSFNAMVGLDGAWLGAVTRNSYFSFTLAPGEHHVCTEQLPAGLNHSQHLALLQLNAEAGRTYFVRVRNIHDRYQQFFDFQTLDPDEGKLLLAHARYVVSREK